MNNNNRESIDELILELIKKLSDEFDKKYLGKSVIGKYLRIINEIKVSRLSISLENHNDLIVDIKNNFAKLLIEICENFEDKEIFFVIDDINGFSNNIEFITWYKSLFESIHCHYLKLS